MSRPVNISDTLTFSPATYVSGSAASVSNPTNPIGEGSSNTTYAQVNLTTGSSATTEAIWSFDCSSIPVGATITSVTCSCKCSINNTQSNRITTRQVQLYSGTTAKGSAYTVANSTTAFNITCGSWTRAELQNARIRLYAVRGTSNTTTNYYFRFYGATLTVNYSASGTEYEVSISNTSETVTSDPSTTQYVFQGGNQEITFYNISSLDDIEITDNNTNVNSSLVYKTSISTVFSANPSSISGSNGTITNGNNGLTGTDSNTYAQLRLLSGTYLEYSFNTSSIPSDATITSISCKAKGCLTTGSAYGNYQLYSGSTAKGSTTAISPSNNVIIQDLTCGTWTRNELSDCRIRITSTYTRNSEYYANFYGSDLTVNYTVSGQFYTYTISNISADHSIVIADKSSESLYLKVNGQFVKCSKIYKKINNVWTEVTLDSLTTPGIYIKK